MGRGGARGHWEVTEERGRRNGAQEVDVPSQAARLIWAEARVAPPPLAAALIQASSFFLGLWHRLLTGLLASRPSSALPSVELSDRHDRWLSFSR